MKKAIKHLKQKNIWRKAKIFERKQKKKKKCLKENNKKYLKESKNIYIWRKAMKNIWRKVIKNIWRKVKKIAGKQNYLKESKNTWGKAKPFLREFWHLRVIVEM